jgi:hypothetical protein
LIALDPGSEAGVTDVNVAAPALAEEQAKFFPSIL